MSTKAILIKIYDRNIINEDNSICHGELLLKPFFFPLRSENDIDSINYKQFNYCCRFLKLLFFYFCPSHWPDENDILVLKKFYHSFRRDTSDKNVNSGPRTVPENNTSHVVNNSLSDYDQW